MPHFYKHISTSNILTSLFRRIIFQKIIISTNKLNFVCINFDKSNFDNNYFDKTSTRKKKDGSVSYILIDDNYYEYKLSYKASNGKITWRCNSSEYPNRNGSVSTIGMYKPITNIKEHEHVSSIKTKVKEVKSEMKQMAASQPDTKPRKIIFECQKNLMEEVVALLPTYNAARQLCSRARIDPY